MSKNLLTEEEKLEKEEDKRKTPGKLIDEFSKVTGYKTSIQTSTAFLNTSNKYVETD